MHLRLLRAGEIKSNMPYGTPFFRYNQQFDPRRLAKDVVNAIMPLYSGYNDKGKISYGERFKGFQDFYQALSSNMPVTAMSNPSYWNQPLSAPSARKRPPPVSYDHWPKKPKPNYEPRKPDPVQDPRYSVTRVSPNISICGGLYHRKVIR